MSLSLIGIIFVQSYYISNSVSNKEDNFNLNVKQALIKVTKTVYDEEYRDHVYEIRKLLAQDVNVVKDTSAIINLYVKQENQDKNETIVYTNGILEENYKFPSSLFDIGLDTISIKKVISKSETKTYKTSEIDGEVKANEILKDFKPLMTKEEYLEFMNSNDKTIKG